MSGIDLKRTSGLPTQGVHLCKITRAEEKASNSSGDPQWVVEFTVQDAGEDQGKAFVDFYPLSQAARFKLDPLLDAIKAAKNGRMEAPELVGKTLRVGVQHAKFEGRTTAKALITLPVDSKDNPTIPDFKEPENRLPKNDRRSDRPVF